MWNKLMAIHLKQAAVAAGLVLVVSAMPGPVFAASVDKERSEKFFTDAQALGQKGEIRAAIIQLKNALKNDPENVSARKLLGSLYVNVGNGPAAEKELKGAIRRGATDSEVWINLGKAYLQQRKYDQVLREIKTAGASAEHRVSLTIIRANAHLRMRQFDEAKTLFEEARLQGADDTRPLIGLTRVYLNKKQPKESEIEVDKALAIDGKSVDALVLKGELRRVNRDLEGAIAHFDRAVEQDEKSVQARLGRAAVLADLNRDADAQTDIDVIFRLAPKHPMASYLSALLRAKKRDYAGAMEMLQEAGNFLRNHLPSMFLQGAVAYAQGQMEQAVASLSRYVEAAPKNVRARKLLGAAYVRKREPERAIEVLAPVEQVNPDDAQVLSLLGSAYMQRSDYNKGIAYYERAAEIAPKASSIRTQIALGRLASGDTKGAVGSLEDAIEIDPGARRATLMLTLVQLRQKNYDEAIKGAENLRKSMPENPLPANLLGAALIGKGKIAEARQSFQDALKIREDFHPARMNLAQLELGDNKVEAAKQHYQKVLELNPKHTGAMMALSTIAFREKREGDGVSLLLQAGDANPNATAPRYRLIDFYVQRNQMEKALSIARQLEQKYPKNPRVLQTLGNVEMAKKDPISAAVTFERLLLTNPKNSQVHMLLANAQMQAKDIFAARSTLEAAVTNDESFMPARIALVRLDVREKKLEAALGKAERLRLEKPDLATGDMLVGEVHMIAKRYTEAVKAYNAALQKKNEPGFVTRRYQARMMGGEKEKAFSELEAWLQKDDNPSIRQLLASGYITEKKYEAAIRHSKLIISKDKKNPIALNNLAWLFQNKGDKRALEFATRALESAPSSPAIMDTLGWILVTGGDAAAGLKHLTKAAELAPKAPDILYHKAAALEKTGKLATAKGQLEKLLLDHKKFETRADAEKLLKKLQAGG